MVNKQVMGERKGGEGLGEGRTHSRQVLRGFLYRRKGAQEGHCVQGALWSHTAYEIYLHVFATLGSGALSWCTELPSRRLVEAVTIGPELATPGPGLGVSVNLYSLWASIYRQEA